MNEIRPIFLLLIWTRKYIAHRSLNMKWEKLLSFTIPYILNKSEGKTCPPKHVNQVRLAKKNNARREQSNDEREENTHQQEVEEKKFGKIDEFIHCCCCCRKYIYMRYNRTNIRKKENARPQKCSCFEFTLSCSFSMCLCVLIRIVYWESVRWILCAVCFCYCAPRTQCHSHFAHTQNQRWMDVDTTHTLGRCISRCLNNNGEFATLDTHTLIHSHNQIHSNIKAQIHWQRQAGWLAGWLASNQPNTHSHTHLYSLMMENLINGNEK